MYFEPLFSPESHIVGTGWLFGFTNEELLVCIQGDTVSIPLLEPSRMESDKMMRIQPFGILDGYPCLTAELPGDFSVPEGMAFMTLRKLFALLPEEWFMLAGRAYQIMNWNRDHQYCGQCGKSTETSAEERVKVCSSCGQLYYPRVSPAIIVSIMKGDKILLARSSKFRNGSFSVLAGFVEPGETLEECVRREVMEEVSIKVKRIRYFGSQSWPFPHSLMIGFTAQFESGDIIIDDKEILEADWFSADELPAIPGGFSISRRLLDAFMNSSLIR